MWSLAYPAIITMISQTIMWTVDSAMVGHVGKIELAAVGFGGLLVFTLYSFFVGLSHSVNTYVSQSLGAGRRHECARYMWQGVYLSIGSGAAILLIRTLNTWTVDLLGPAPEVRPLCVLYADIRMLAAPFFILHYYYSNFFRGIGNTRTPMKVAIVANAVNIVVDYVLIFGAGPFPALGVAGAAWATFIATVLSAVILGAISFAPLYRRRFQTHRHWRLRPRHIARLLGVGVPIGLHYVMDIGAFLVFSAYVGRMGTEALAANQITIQILALSFMPCNGFSVAATTLMGRYIGAGSPDLAKRAGTRAIRLGMIFTGLVAVSYVLFPGFLVRLFNDDPLVVRYGRHIILLAAVFQFFDGVQIVTGGALRGAGDTRTPMMLALGGGWLLFLPLAYVFGTMLARGVVGAWTGATLEIIVLGIAMFVRFKTDRWKKISLSGIGGRDETPAEPIAHV